MTLAATIVAVTGAVLVVLRPGATGDARGIALSVAAVAACACYTVLTRKLLLDDGTVGVVLAQQLVALALVVVAVAGASAIGVSALGGADPSGSPSPPASSTTASRSRRTSPGCDTCRPRWRAPCCPRSRCSG